MQVRHGYQQPSSPQVMTTMKLSPITLLLVLTALCASTSAYSGEVLPLSPVEAVQLAASVAPDQGVQGKFLLTVKASGDDKRRGKVYLNSELDYRDQRNLTIEIERSAFPELEAKYGKNLKTYFIGKQVLVSGIAKRVTIFFGKPRISAVNGKPRSNYYFQTHVQVLSADQILLVPQSPDPS
jgi:hypothetical protein